MTRISCKAHPEVADMLTAGNVKWWKFSFRTKMLGEDFRNAVMSGLSSALAEHSPKFQHAPVSFPKTGCHKVREPGEWVSLETLVDCQFYLSLSLPFFEPNNTLRLCLVKLHISYFPWGSSKPTWPLGTTPLVPRLHCSLGLWPLCGLHGRDPKELLRVREGHHLSA